jgi:hypothetical protein
VSQGPKRIVCVRKSFLLSFTTKFRSFQALEPAAILFLMLLQAVLCWALTEIKVVTLSFGVGRSLSEWDKTFCVCVHFSQSWAPSCVFELLEIYVPIKILFFLRKGGGPASVLYDRHRGDTPRILLYEPLAVSCSRPPSPP